MDKLKTIEIAPYNTNWPLQYEYEAQKIKKALKKTLVNIHHVGSTSVPELDAKPIIDIIAEVRTLNFEHNALLNLGYDYRGSFNIPLKKTFTARKPDVRINLHIVEQDNPEIELNLLFRDYLRKNKTAKDEYESLKYQLIKKETSHQKNNTFFRGYTLGKYELIQKILKKTGFKKLRFVFCSHYAEWEAAKSYRHKYFFQPNNIDDPYTWTFNHKDHKHFILYKGSTILGYAHIQLWPNYSAALRIIVIDKTMRRQGLGTEFMFLIEKWLKRQGYKSIHSESPPSALNFYKSLGYTPMPFNDPDHYEGSPQDITMGKIFKTSPLKTE